jgi:prepilin peptidase CpaA
MVITSVIIVVSLIALYTDVRWLKIYNWLTLPALLCGLVLNPVVNGWWGLLDSVEGFAFAFAVSLPFYGRLFFGGDVKLLCALGAIGGVKFTMGMLLYAGVAGGIEALLWTAYQGTLSQTWDRFKQLSQSLFYPGVQLERPLHSSDSPPFPYGIAIATGAVLRIAFPEWLPL